MKSMSLRQRMKSKGAAWLSAIVLTATLFAAMGAGPDDTTASSVNNDWEIFEGHAYADNRAAPAGVSLIACLGGCDDGYASTPVITGEDGIYQVKVDPGQLMPDGRMVTFWLMDGSERVEAHQDVLFRGNGETRVLDLNFDDLPPAPIVNTVNDRQTGGFTTDLTVPSASALGLVPGDTPRAYVNSVSYDGMPLLPGFASVLGLILIAAGASALVYRRRLIW